MALEIDANSIGNISTILTDLDLRLKNLDSDFGRLNALVYEDIKTFAHGLPEWMGQECCRLTRIEAQLANVLVKFLEMEEMEKHVASLRGYMFGEGNVLQRLTGLEGTEKELRVDVNWTTTILQKLCKGQTIMCERLNALTTLVYTPKKARKAKKAEKSNRSHKRKPKPKKGS